MKYRITSKGDGIHFYGYWEDYEKTWIVHEVIRVIGVGFFIAKRKATGLNTSWNPIPKKDLIFVTD